MSQLVPAKLLTLRAGAAVYCDTLLAAGKGRPPRPTVTPSHPAGRPDSRPTVTGTERPGSHKPTARPTH
ncbi:hypothetical protein [Micromonospora fulviviridis]|uniref:Uncharacterized protein n=1 Tax=Micromonospora fulviviridis TaxID=47860 RepID=A0ABV2VY24_9ACTN